MIEARRASERRNRFARLRFGFRWRGEKCDIFTREQSNPVLEERTPPMQNVNRFGLFLASLFSKDFDQKGA